MKLFLYLSVFVSTFVYSQTPEEFTIEIEPLTITNAPGVQSFSWGTTSDAKWVILGGRIDGLHRRQPNSAFLDADNNKFVFVIDPVSEQVWSADISTLPTSIYEQLKSTNQNFVQRGNTLYIVGGYGYSATAVDHITYPNLTAVDLDGLANAVIGTNPIDSYFRQITDLNMKITGGQLEILDDTFYLVGGQLFDGRYNPMGPTNGPGFVQVYSNDIRTFNLIDDGTNLTITNYQAVHDETNLHRRDYNMMPQIFPNGDLGFTAFSGVFDLNDMPYLNSVDITSPTAYVTNNSFNQYLSQYHSAKLPIYDTAAHIMHNIFFGGMSQFTLDINGSLVEDVNVPFVKTISRVTRNSNGTMQEFDLGYIEMPALLGSGAEFIPIDQLYYENHVLNLNDLPNTKTLVGYIYGGIESTAANIFNINDGTQSFASNVIFKVYINKSSLGFDEEIPLVAQNVLNLNVYPNPIKKNMNLTFFGSAIGDLSINIFDNSGRVVLEDVYYVESIGKQELNYNVSKLSDGVYTIQMSNGVLTDQKKFIKQ